MSEELAYIKAIYGRNAGKFNVTRFCKIDQEGKISFIDERIPLNKDKATMWRMGNVKFLNFTEQRILPSTEKEFTEKMQLAIKSIL
jgi:hypothetical protein